MNRKGQIGKLITIFPIMLLVFVIMGVFVVLSAIYSIGGTGKSGLFFSDGVVNVSAEDLMLKTMSVDLQDGKGVRDMNVLDVVVSKALVNANSQSEELLSDQLHPFFMPLLNAEMSRLFIYTDKGSIVNLEYPGGVVSRSLTLADMNSILPDYSHHVGMRQTSFLKEVNGKDVRIYLRYYYGPK